MRSLQELVWSRDIQANDFQVRPLCAQSTAQTPDTSVDRNVVDVIPLHGNGSTSEEPSVLKAADANKMTCIIMQLLQAKKPQLRRLRARRHLDQGLSNSQQSLHKSKWECARARLAKYSLIRCAVLWLLLPTFMRRSAWHRPLLASSLDRPTALMIRVRSDNSLSSRASRASSEVSENCTPGSCERITPSWQKQANP